MKEVCVIFGDAKVKTATVNQIWLPWKPWTTLSVSARTLEVAGYVCDSKTICPLSRTRSPMKYGSIPARPQQNPSMDRTLTTFRGGQSTKLFDGVEV